MTAMHRGLIVMALAGAVVMVFVMKREKPHGDSGPERTSVRAVVAGMNEDTAAPRQAPSDEALPRLVDLGAGKCIPCKMMAPILDELSRECADSFAVEFIDVWQNPEAGEKFGIRMIPTQIFYNAVGEELFRHEGFFGKDEILAKWREFGVTVTTTSTE